MKLPIKKRYFDMILNGKKDLEFRDAHITFICEKTKRTLRVDVEEVDMVDRLDVNKKYRHLFKDKKVIKFWLDKESLSKTKK